MKLSIITINYNNCEGLRKTIDSVISQTWQDFEWIIVDGGSTDGSRELIVQTAAQLEAQGWTTEQFSGPEDPAAYIADNQPSINDPSSIVNPSSSHRLLWCSEKDKGIYNAMNKGIVHAEGEYCLFLNSGDCLFEKTTLGNTLGNILGAEDFIIGRIRTNRGITSTFSSYYSLFHLANVSFPHQASFIARSVFYRYGLYNEALKIVSDWELFIKALIHGTASFIFCDIIVCQMEDGGISMDQKKLAIEKCYIADTYFSSQLLTDLRRSQSLADVLGASFLTRKLYSALYRIALFIRGIKKLIYERRISST